MLCKLSPLVTWCQEMSTADSHCQEAEQIIQTRNCAFLQAEDKKGRLGSCVFGEMWKNEIAEARSCVSNEVIHLISSVLFSQFLCLLWPMIIPNEDAWLHFLLLCLSLLHCSLRPFPETRGGVFHQAEGLFTPDLTRGAGLNPCFTGQWQALLGCWVWLTCPRGGIWESPLTPHKLDAEHLRTRWYFVLSVSRTCLEDKQTEGLSPHACKARSYCDQFYYIPSL